MKSSKFNKIFRFLVQLLHRFFVRASDKGGLKLLQVIKNPVTDHLPVGCRKICTSFSADKVVPCKDLPADQDEPIAFVVGAIAHGKIEVDYVDQTVSLSNYPLSAALTCTKLCSAFEDKWGVL